MTEEQMEVVRLHMRDTYDVAPWEWDSGELELAIYELITKNQAKNNEVLDLVSKCDNDTKDLIEHTKRVIDLIRDKSGIAVKVLGNRINKKLEQLK